ncbi:MAG: hypothetical protein IKG27_06820 [Bacilli bacterium]|nr:hypothetical protein [Bacilli bacterium]
MKNVINYYYNLYPENIFQIAQGHYFYIKNIKYMFIKYDKDIDKINEIYNMHLEILNNNLYIHHIILNIDGKPLTIIENIPYILMKVIYHEGQVTLEHILSFQNKIIEKSIYNPGKLWEIKNDYLEYQISMLGKNHPLIKESFSYFIGLGETAISIVNNLPKIPIDKVYAHKRITSNYTIFDLYNPLNIIIDSKIRDISEYFKQNFFNDKNIEQELCFYLNNIKLNNEEYVMFFARMLYPTYYFDIYEEIITDREKEEKLLKILDKVNDYENILKQIYRQIKNLPTIDWLE